MQFGVQFFPDVRPEEKSAEQYFQEALDLAEEADRLGFSHIRIVEHYFHHYGGYSPNPIVFLAAAAHRTRRARLVTGAVLPAFNHPLKLAGEIAMLDALSRGRLDVGFARAFLPHEFRRFGVSPDESVARFREGIEQVDLLRPRERHASRPLSPDREHNVAAAPDATATAEILCRGIEHAGIFRIRRADGLCGHGDRACRREDAAPPCRLSRGLEGGWAPRARRGHDRLSPVLRPRRRARSRLRL